MDIYLPSLVIGELIVVGLCTPEELNAPAADIHPRVPSPIKITDKMTTQALDLGGSSWISVTKSGLFLSHQDSLCG